MSLGFGRRRTWFNALAFAALIGVGLWARYLTPDPGLARFWPWTGSMVVTPYFQTGAFLFPVARRVPVTDDRARASLQALLDGPVPSSGLASTIASGTEIRALTVADGLARIELTGPVVAHAEDYAGAKAMIVATLTALPDVREVEVHADGGLLVDRTTRQPLLYFASSEGIVAVPTAAGTPRVAVDAFLAGPGTATLRGLPGDVRLTGYTHDEDGVVSLDFTYTDSVRTLAIETPDIMRFVLIGLTASLTEFAGVSAVKMDFEGRSRLGLGQCSDLLRVAQPRPRLLNDERLVRRGEGRP